MKKLPEYVYLIEMDDGTLLADREVCDFHDGAIVGVYKLQATREKETTHALIEWPKKRKAKKR